MAFPSDGMGEGSCGIRGRSAEKLGGSDGEANRPPNRSVEEDRGGIRPEVSWNLGVPRAGRLRGRGFRMVIPSAIFLFLGELPTPGLFAPPIWFSLQKPHCAPHDFALHSFSGTREESSRLQDAHLLPHTCSIRAVRGMRILSETGSRRSFLLPICELQGTFWFEILLFLAAPVPDLVLLHYKEPLPCLTPKSQAFRDFLASH